MRVTRPSRHWLLAELVNEHSFNKHQNLPILSSPLGLLRPGTSLTYTYVPGAEHRAWHLGGCTDAPSEGTYTQEPQRSLHHLMLPLKESKTGRPYRSVHISKHFTNIPPWERKKERNGYIESEFFLQSRSTSEAD